MNRKNLCSAILIIVTGLFLVSPLSSQELILPDSGQRLCYDWERIICDDWHMEGYNQVCDSQPYCPEKGEDFYGQDATYSINPPDLTDNGDGTIKDNLTGLTWEQKSEINELLTFTYAEALNYCADLELGGKDDWRIPARPEYSSILNSNFTSPALDTEFFPHYTSSGTGAVFYWTASEVHNDASQAWTIIMSFGLIGARSKILPCKIRCVSGSTLPVSSFVDNKDGTVTDDTTGLMWEQKTDDGSSRDRDIARTWKDSLQYCEDLNLGGYSDWRLPTTREQERIVDLEKSNPAADTQFFPNTQNALYWSGTSCAGCHKHKALSTDYTDGTVYFGYKKRINPLNEGEKEYPEHYDRCVRGGHTILSIVHIDKCKVKAGENGKGDSMGFSGVLDANTDDFDAAIGEDVVVTIEADDIPNTDVATFFFPIEEGFLKKGKYKAPKVKSANKNDPVTSLQIDTNKGKMKFSGKNLDLTGLGCPIVITIQIGDYVAAGMVYEDIVNGPNKPCPPELREGI